MKNRKMDMPDRDGELKRKEDEKMATDVMPNGRIVIKAEAWNDFMSLQPDPIQRKNSQQIQRTFEKNNKPREQVKLFSPSSDED